jgi:hypothetical protein
LPLPLPLLSPLPLPFFLSFPQGICFSQLPLLLPLPLPFFLSFPQGICFSPLLPFGCHTRRQSAVALAPSWNHEAVFAAYGGPPNLTGQEIRARLLTLNHERAAAQKSAH